MKHSVIWKMKADVSAEQKASMKAQLEALKGVVSELVEIEVGIDEENGTMSLMSEFVSTADLAVYQAHPAHQKVVAFVKPLVAERAVCDYEC